MAEDRELRKITNYIILFVTFVILSLFFINYAALVKVDLPYALIDLSKEVNLLMLNLIVIIISAFFSILILLSVKNYLKERKKEINASF